MSSFEQATSFDRETSVVPAHADRSRRGFARSGALTLCAALAVAGVIAWQDARPASALISPEFGGDQPISLVLRAGGQSVVGESEMLGRPVGSIEVLSFHHQLAYTNRSGTVTGMANTKFNPGMIEIRKKVDSTSPRLAELLATNETLEAELHFYRAHVSNGQSEEYFIVTLKRAGLVKVEQDLALVTGGSSATRMPAIETLSLTFEEYESSAVGGPGPTFFWSRK